jgi:hypothetical protein
MLLKCSGFSLQILLLQFLLSLQHDGPAFSFAGVAFGGFPDEVLMQVFALVFFVWYLG